MVAQISFDHVMDHWKQHGEDSRTFFAQTSYDVTMVPWSTETSSFFSDYISETKQDRSILIWSWERSSVTASKRFRIIFARTSLWRHIALFPIDLCISACISDNKQHSSNLISPLNIALNYTKKIITNFSSWRQMTSRWWRNPICSFDSCRLRRSLCVLPFPFHDYLSDKKHSIFPFIFFPFQNCINRIGRLTRDD